MTTAFATMYHDQVIYDERRTGCTPLRHLTTGFFDHVARPNALTGREPEAVEDSRCAEGEDTVAHDSGGRTRALAGNGGMIMRRVSMNPKLPASLQGVSDDTFVFTTLLLGQAKVANDHKPRPRRANGFAPDDLWRVG